MTNIEKMKLVDKITDEISEQLGVLTRYGMFTFEEGIALIKQLSCKQNEWFKQTFTEDEYREFMREKFDI